MQGPFTVIFEDYFGLIHEFHAWANSSSQAIRQAESAYEYPMKIIDVYIDYDIMLNCSGFFSPLSEWLSAHNYI